VQRDESSHTRTYKVTQFEVIEEGDCEGRTRFCKRVLRAVCDGFLYANLKFFTDEAWFYLELVYQFSKQKVLKRYSLQTNFLRAS
jgi:hypothetical protein